MSFRRLTKALRYLSCILFLVLPFGRPRRADAAVRVCASGESTGFAMCSTNMSSSLGGGNKHGADATGSDATNDDDVDEVDAAVRQWRW